MVSIDRPLIEGIFIRRDNRFRATVQLNGERVGVHVPNSGRLHELFVLGRQVLLAQVPAAHRKTDYDLVMVRVGKEWVSMDARLPSVLFAEAVDAGQLKAFRGYAEIKREVDYGESRLDFRLSGAGRLCYVEVKSVTLVEDGTGLFPDAPTTRGQRHIRELMKARERGNRAAIAFIIQRDDVQHFAPHDKADPDFAQILRQAAEDTVEVYAYKCQVNRRCVEIIAEIPVLIE